MKEAFLKIRDVWGLVLLVTLAFCYAKVFEVLMGQWWSNDMYSYGFLIPGISLYLIWMGRKRLSQLELDPHYAGGFIVLISGLLMLIIGQAGGVVVIQELSLIVTITGVVLLVLGKQFLRALWFPIAYLLFMIPIWEIVTDRLHFPFQSFTANIGVAIMQLIGVPAHREGVFIELPNITLEVADVCSGINYLIAVVAIGIPVCYLFLEGWKRRAILIGFAVIVAALTNSLRVGLIGIFSYYGLVKNLHGPFHVLQALSVSFVGYGALFAGLSVLSRKQDASPLLQGHVSVHEPSEPTQRTGKLGYLGMSISIIFLLVGSYIHYYKPLPVPLKADSRSFPFAIGEWWGQEHPVEYSVYRSLGVDQELSRVYRDDSGKVVGLYVGYYKYQEQGKELVSYKTEDLHRNASRLKVNFDRYGFIEINQVILQQGMQKKLILFWYDLNGRIVTRPYLAKFYTAWDAVSHRRTNGAIIMVSMKLDDTDDLQTVSQRMQAFIRQFMPELQNYLPDA